MKKYLITGFSGFVSYWFLKYLDSAAEEKIEILGLDLNRPEKFDDGYNFKNLEIRFIPLNLLDSAALEICLASFSPDFVLHLAAFSSVGASWKSPVASVMNNTNIFLNLVDAVRKNKIKCRILSVGSSEEYGNVSAGEIPLREDRLLNPVSPYAIARVSQEMLSKCYADSFGQDIIMTRSFNHIGPGQKDIFVVPSFVRQIVQGKLRGEKNIVLKAGDVSIIRDFTDVRDVVRAYVLLLEKGKSGELYNVCSGKGNSLEEIIAKLAEMACVQVSVQTDPQFVRPNDNMIIVGDNSKLKKATGWEPFHSLEETLRDMMNFAEK
jgi:GDP-4-dehydro-6-deoxy-D-mannose reductase